VAGCFVSGSYLRSHPVEWTQVVNCRLHTLSGNRAIMPVGEIDRAIEESTRQARRTGVIGLSGPRSSGEHKMGKPNPSCADSELPVTRIAAKVSRRDPIDPARTDSQRNRRKKGPGGSQDVLHWGQTLSLLISARNLLAVLCPEPIKSGVKSCLRRCCVMAIFHRRGGMP
jgi:hypothetical protein